MPAEMQRDVAEHERDNAGQHDAGKQSEPGRPAHRRRQIRGRVGADADKGRLPERGDAAAAGQQHEAERHQRVDADIVHQRDDEAVRQQRQHRHGYGEQRDQHIAKRAGHGYSSSYFVGVMRRNIEPAPQHDRDDRGEDDRLLQRARIERAEGFDQSDDDGADRGQRIADETADHRTDEALQADDQAGVVIDRRGRRDQDAGDGGDCRRQAGTTSAPARVVQMPTRRAPSRLIAVARSALPVIVNWKNDVQDRREQGGGADDQQQCFGNVDARDLRRRRETKAWVRNPSGPK